MSDRPRLRPDLVLVEQTYRGEQSFILKDPTTHKYFRFRPVEIAVMQSLDGQRTVPEAAVALVEQGIRVSAAAVAKFAEKLKKRKDVRLFVKLPNWFKVATPVGQYNPDWALVMDKPDEEDVLLYLVRETKSTTVADELRGTENQKIHCGEQHFVGGLNVDFRVVTNADELP